VEPADGAGPVIVLHVVAVFIRRKRINPRLRQVVCYRENAFLDGQIRWRGEGLTSLPEM
jgi:hypothetical protein